MKSILVTFVVSNLCLVTQSSILPKVQAKAPLENSVVLRRQIANDPLPASFLDMTCFVEAVNTAENEPRVHHANPVVSESLASPEGVGASHHTTVAPEHGGPELEHDIPPSSNSSEHVAGSSPNLSEHDNAPSSNSSEHIVGSSSNLPEHDTGLSSNATEHIAAEHDIAPSSNSSDHDPGSSSNLPEQAHSTQASVLAEAGPNEPAADHSSTASPVRKRQAEGDNSAQHANSSDASQQGNSPDSPHHANSPDASHHESSSDAPHHANSPDASQHENSSDAPHHANPPDASQHENSSDAPHHANSPDASQHENSSDAPQHENSQDASQQENSPDASHHSNISAASGPASNETEWTLSMIDNMDLGSLLALNYVSTADKVKHNLEQFKKQCEEHNYKEGQSEGHKCLKSCMLMQFHLINYDKTSKRFKMTSDLVLTGMEDVDPSIFVKLLMHFGVDISSENKILADLTRKVVHDCSPILDEVANVKKLPCNEWDPFINCVENAWRCPGVK